VTTDPNRVGAPEAPPAAPEPQAPGAVYQAGLEAGELRYQHCGGCAAAVFPPRVLCPDCGSTDLAWRTSAGAGTVYSTTVVRGRDGAHNVALIDLDEGFRMMSRVEGGDPAAAAIGDRVGFMTVRQDGAAVAVFGKPVEGDVR